MDIILSTPISSSFLFCEQAVKLSFLNGSPLLPHSPHPPGGGGPSQMLHPRARRLTGASEGRSQGRGLEGLSTSHPRTIRVPAGRVDKRGKPTGPSSLDFTWWALGIGKWLQVHWGGTTYKFWKLLLLWLQAHQEATLRWENRAVRSVGLRNPVMGGGGRWRPPWCKKKTK